MIEELRPADQVELFVELDAKQRDELLPQMDVELAASEPLEERYLSASLFTPARKRGVWPLLLLVAETLTGSVLRHVEHELAAIVALVFFVPLLIGTGGNAGS